MGKPNWICNIEKKIEQSGLNATTTLNKENDEYGNEIIVFTIKCIYRQKNTPISEISSEIYRILELDLPKISKETNGFKVVFSCQFERK